MFDITILKYNIQQRTLDPYYTSYLKVFFIKILLEKKKKLINLNLAMWLTFF